MVMQAERERTDASQELLERIADTIDMVDVALPDQDDATTSGAAPQSMQLADWLETTLACEFELDSITRDQDGDLPIPIGTAVVYVRQGAADSPFVTVVALLLEDFDMTLDVYEAVNTINLQVPMAKTVVDVDRNQIVTSIELPVIDTLSPQDLRFAVETVASVADYFDTMLQCRFGGAIALDA